MAAAAFTYTVLLQPEPEGGYTVTCPALPGLVTYGATLDEGAGHGRGRDPGLRRVPARGR